MDVCGEPLRGPSTNKHDNGVHICNTYRTERIHAQFYNAHMRYYFYQFSPSYLWLWNIFGSRWLKTACEYATDTGTPVITTYMYTQQAHKYQRHALQGIHHSIRTHTLHEPVELWPLLTKDTLTFSNSGNSDSRNSRVPLNESGSNSASMPIDGLKYKHNYPPHAVQWDQSDSNDKL